ncbi:MAG: BrnA antitoxin family protein [Nitrospirae bacterium]|nr:BrnA antitoxin family protein [Nitrospirota bacterium]
MKNKIEEMENYELPEQYTFKNPIRGRFYKPKKVSTTMRFDDDILIYFKKISSEKKIPYQTLVNMVLREFQESYLTGIHVL